LTQQTTPPGSECQSDGNFASTGGSASQQQVGNVRARYQQDDPHQDESDPKRGAEL
jgi:hypothetical protein